MNKLKGLIYMNKNVGLELYEAAIRRNMINQLKELRRNVKAIRGNEIEGGFAGILMALGAEMDRKNGINNKWSNNKTAPIAYEEATKIDNLLKNIEQICSEVNGEKHCFGMLKELAIEFTQRHGKFGEQ